MCNTCNEILKKYPKKNPMYKQGDTKKIVCVRCGDVLENHKFSEAFESIFYKNRKGEIVKCYFCIICQNENSEYRDLGGLVHEANVE